MPIYEYNCQDCKQIFEDWQKDYEERELSCPVCGGQAQRLISSTSFVLKGGGWYASGYTGEPAAPAESAGGNGNGGAKACAAPAPAPEAPAPADPAPAKPKVAATAPAAS